MATIIIKSTENGAFISIESLPNKKNSLNVISEYAISPESADAIYYILSSIINLSEPIRGPKFIIED